MPKSLSKTPAPKKDRIYGSKVNPKGSASSEKSATKIKLSSDIILALTKKLKEFKETHKTKKVSLSDLKAVYRRGLGAYSSTHRPTISGGKPNTRNAWAMARVNAFLRKAGGGEYKKAYVQDDDLLKMHLGGDMSKHLAPNGKPSNLTHEQWHLVRTPEFKAWFGDWENGIFTDYQKFVEYKHKTGTGRMNLLDLQYIVNESDLDKAYQIKEIHKKANDFIESSYDESLKNGYEINFEDFIDEYLSIYQPAFDLIKELELNEDVIIAKKSLEVFDKSKFYEWVNYKNRDISKVVDENGEPLVVYRSIRGSYYYQKSGNQFFTPNLEYAKIFGNNTVSCFLNIRDLLDFEYYNRIIRKKGIETDFNEGMFVMGDAFLDVNKNLWYDNQLSLLEFSDFELSKEIFDRLKEVDGIVGYEAGYYGRAISYLVWNPNQIKLADGTNTTFDRSNPDIRYADGGIVKDYKDNHYKVEYFIDEWKNPYDENGYPMNIVIYAKINKNGEDKLIGRLWVYKIDVNKFKDSKTKLVVKDIESNDYNEYLEIEDAMVIMEFQEQGVYTNLLKKLSDSTQLPIVSFKWQRNGVSELFWKNKKSDNIKNVKSNYIYYPDSKFKDDGEVKSFYRWYMDWYKTIKDEITLMVSFPNKLQPFSENNVVIIDKFKKDRESIKANRYLQEFIDKADEFRITIYLEPKPIGNVKTKSELINYYTKFGFELTPNKQFMKRVPKYANGGEVDEHKETYKKWKSLVNMSYSELKRFYDSEEGKQAGLKPREAKAQGIDSGRESARWILKMKKTPVSEWTPNMWRWANKQISFISRMSGMKGDLYDDKGRKTRKYLSLLIWGNDPKKKNVGGDIDVRMEDTVQRMDDPHFADISYYAKGGDVYEYTLWGVKNGEPDYAEVLLSTQKQNFEKVKKLASKDGYGRFRESKIDMREKPDFTKAIKKENGGESDYEYFIVNCSNFGFIPNQLGQNEHKKLTDAFETLFEFLKGENGLYWMNEENVYFEIDKNYIDKDGREKFKQVYKITGKDALKLHNKKMLENGGTINQSINTNIMDEVKFNQLPHIDTINNNDKIIIHESVFAGSLDKPKHIGERYIHCEVMGKGGMVNSLNLKVLNSLGANALRVGEVITRPVSNVLTKGRKLIVEPIAQAMPSFKQGGLNPDNKEVKQYFAHDSGNAGGVLVGKRHSEGGIKAINKSTGQPLEMEGGEVVITRGAVSNPKKYDFQGKDMTTREILSKLNVDGGGVSFAEGGDVPDKMNCGCDKMDFGGSTMSVQDFVNRSDSEYQEYRLIEGIKKERHDHYDTLSKLNAGTITIDQALGEIAKKEMKLDSKYPFAE